VKGLCGRTPQVAGSASHHDGLVVEIHAMFP
jgi:hypothetical protein